MKHMLLEDLLHAGLKKCHKADGRTIQWHLNQAVMEYLNKEDPLSPRQRAIVSEDPHSLKNVLPTKITNVPFEDAA